MNQNLKEPLPFAIVNMMEMSTGGGASCSAVTFLSECGNFQQE